MAEFFKKIFKKLFGNYEWVVDFSEFITRRDIKKARVTSAIGYVFFFVPLVFHGDNQYARFHINQSIINLILSTIGVVVFGLIPYVGIFLAIAQMALSAVWMVRGIVLALQGKAKSIPLVGWVTIIAYRLPGQEKS